MECVYESDVQLVQQKWNALCDGEAVTFEMRWNGRTEDGVIDPREESAVWVQASCVPVVDDKGSIVSISGCTTDISSQKHVEDVQNQRTKELLALKRQQEKYVLSFLLSIVRQHKFHSEISYPIVPHMEDVSEAADIAGVYIAEGTVFLCRRKALDVL